MDGFAVSCALSCAQAVLCFAVLWLQGTESPPPPLKVKGRLGRPPKMQPKLGADRVQRLEIAPSWHQEGGEEGEKGKGGKEEGGRERGDAARRRGVEAAEALAALVAERNALLTERSNNVLQVGLLCCLGRCVWQQVQHQSSNQQHVGCLQRQSCDTLSPEVGRKLACCAEGAYLVNEAQYS